MKRRDFLTLATAGVFGVTMPTAARAQATVGRMRDTKRFEQRIELIRRSLDIPGMSVAVLHRQEVILARGFGVVDLAKGTPASEHTPYPIASLTKTFAAAIIMRLVEEGKLDLDQPMSRYDPGYAQWCSELKARNTPWGRNYNCDSERITVRHHLTHTAQRQTGHCVSVQWIAIRAPDRGD
jgi:CubicO group peptidase (beta-lactamase class C family)